jgi:hypothetical protein
MTKKEIDIAADMRYRGAISTFGLKNGKKISLSVYRLFKAEDKRRKEKIAEIKSRR